MAAARHEMKAQDLRVEDPRRRQAELRLDALAAAVREHERTVSERPYSVRYADLSLYRRLRQIAGGA
jgi:hypothetical protein